MLELILFNLSLFIVDYFTGQEIYDNLYESIPVIENQRKKRILMNYFYFSLVTVGISLIMNHFNILTSYITVLTLIINMFLISCITDPKTHEINRFSLRFVYLYLLYYFITTGNTAYHIALGITTVIILGLFFFDTSTGSSDYRALYITLITSLYYMGIYGLYLTIFIVVITSIIIKVQQFKAKFKINVPVGPVFMAGAPLSMIIGIYFELILKNFL